MSPQLLPLHKYPQYMLECCQLINDEWKRSETARLRSLEGSSDKLPTCLILLKLNKVIGHVKLSSIPSIKTACFLESVVIDRKLRGQGLGTNLMKQTETYCKDNLGLKTIYLSTKGQEEFYKKCGYSECQPISIYGAFTPKQTEIKEQKTVIISALQSGPPPPPLPQQTKPITTKTFMKKDL